MFLFTHTFNELRRCYLPETQFLCQMFFFFLIFVPFVFLCRAPPQYSSGPQGYFPYAARPYQQVQLLLHQRHPPSPHRLSAVLQSTAGNQQAARRLCQLEGTLHQQQWSRQPAEHYAHFQRHVSSIF